MKRIDRAVKPPSVPAFQPPSEIIVAPQKGKVILIWAILLGFLGGILGALVVFVFTPPIIKDIKQKIVTQKEERIIVKEESGIIEAVKKVQPSVVSIISTSNVMGFFGRIYEQKGGGTGFIISEDGLILTNKHVISDRNAKYTVLLADGRSFAGKVISTDPLNDIGVLRIDASNLKTAELGDSDKLEIGQRVIALGNALGEFQNTVTTGIVSAVHRTIMAGEGEATERLEDLIQTDAAINPGNSGGPLINLAGQVVGINTAIAEQAENIGFAIPINQAKYAINSVRERGRIIRPFLGVRYVMVTKQLAKLEHLAVDHGALLTSDEEAVAVLPNSPAGKAGLRKGDIIVKVNGQTLDENNSLTKVLIQFEPGTTVEITFVRDGVEHKVNVTLGELKD